MRHRFRIAARLSLAAAVAALVGGCDDPPAPPAPPPSSPVRPPAAAPAGDASGAHILDMRIDATGPVPDGLKGAVADHVRANLHRKGESWFATTDGGRTLYEFRLTTVRVSEPYNLTDADRLNGLTEARGAWVVGSSRAYHGAWQNAKWSSWTPHDREGMGCTLVNGKWSVVDGPGSLARYDPCPDPDRWLADAARAADAAPAAAPTTGPAAPVIVK
ncbi:MAG TPA: hypothetical protein VEA69_06705 [Tepidisphaeraceae bacterium]|nr:hypothetical protein [Tepidisphaeraceae bacterium]